MRSHFILTAHETEIKLRIHIIGLVLFSNNFFKFFQLCFLNFFFVLEISTRDNHRNSDVVSEQIINQ